MLSAGSAICKNRADVCNSARQPRRSATKCATPSRILAPRVLTDNNGVTMGYWVSGDAASAPLVQFREFRAGLDDEKIEHTHRGEVE
jgi:hypothetical protein